MARCERRELKGLGRALNLTVGCCRHGPVAGVLQVGGKMWEQTSEFARIVEAAGQQAMDDGFTVDVTQQTGDQLVVAGLGSRGHWSPHARSSKGRATGATCCGWRGT